MESELLQSVATVLWWSSTAYVCVSFSARFSVCCSLSATPWWGLGAAGHRDRCWRWPSYRLHSKPNSSSWPWLLCQSWRWGLLVNRQCVCSQCRIEWGCVSEGWGVRVRSEGENVWVRGEGENVWVRGVGENVWVTGVGENMWGLRVRMFSWSGLKTWPDMDEGEVCCMTWQALKPKSRSVLQLYREIAKAGSESGQFCLNDHEMQQIWSL